MSSAALGASSIPVARHIPQLKPSTGKHGAFRLYFHESSAINESIKCQLHLIMATYRTGTWLLIGVLFRNVIHGRFMRV